MNYISYIYYLSLGFDLPPIMLCANGVVVRTGSNTSILKHKMSYGAVLFTGRATLQPVTYLGIMATHGSRESENQVQEQTGETDCIDIVIL